MQRFGQARPAQRFDKPEIGRGRDLAQVAGHARGQAAAADRQDHHVGRAAKLLQQLDGNRGLTLDHVGIIEGRQEMCLPFGAIGLGGGKCLVEVVARQLDPDVVAAKDAGLVDLLLRGGDGHEDHPLHAKVAAGEGDTLGVVARTCADELVLVGLDGADLAHGVEGPAQLVAADGREVFALEPDFGVIAGRQKVVPLQGRLGEKLTQGNGGLAGGGAELGHDPQMPEGRAGGKECLGMPGLQEAQGNPCPWGRLGLSASKIVMEPSRC